MCVSLEVYYGVYSGALPVVLCCVGVRHALTTVVTHAVVILVNSNDNDNNNSNNNNNNNNDNTSNNNNPHRFTNCYSN